MQYFAGIDIGTNTLLLLIVSKDQEGKKIERHAKKFVYEKRMIASYWQKVAYFEKSFHAKL
jgi:exopolyphosphatase/pppGpp-phosphohydrolase